MCCPFVIASFFLCVGMQHFKMLHCNILKCCIAKNKVLHCSFLANVVISRVGDDIELQQTKFCNAKVQNVAVQNFAMQVFATMTVVNLHGG